MKTRRRELTEPEKAAAARLRELWAEKKGRHQAATGEKLSQASASLDLGFKSEGAFAQYLRGYIPLNVKQLLNFAHYLGVEPRDIYPELAATLDSNRYETPQQLLATGLFEAREAKAIYKTTDRDLLIAATHFLFTVIGMEVAERRGAEWTATTLLKLHDLFQDPASKDLDPKTILKLIA